MFLKLVKFYIKNTLQKLVKNTGFSLRYSKYDFDGSHVIKKYIMGGLLFFGYAVRRLLNIITGRFELDYVEVFITSKCTVRCKDCSILIPYQHELQDFDADSIINDLKKFLGYVDYVHKLGILGGEAMLHRDFVKILEFAANISKVGSIRIVTNGTYIPNESILGVLKATPNVYMNISEYPLLDSGKKQRLENVLKENEIKFSVYKDQEWSDLGSPVTPKEENGRILRKRFKRCWMNKCNGLLDGRVYMCGRSAFLPRIYKIDNGDTDYLDIRSITDNNDGRKKLKKMLKKRVLAACAYCNGTFDAAKIQPAIQLEKQK